MFLICMMLPFVSRKRSTIGVESPKNASAAAGTEEVGLANWKLATLTWALVGKATTGTVSLAD